MNYMMRYQPRYHPCTDTARIVYGSFEKSLERWHLLRTLQSLPWA